MCIPTTTKSLLSFTVANDTNKLEFKADSGRMIKSLILNLQERLPIKYIFVQLLFSLTSGCIIENKACNNKVFKAHREALWQQANFLEGIWSVKSAVWTFH